MSCSFSLVHHHHQTQAVTAHVYSLQGALIKNNNFFFENKIDLPDPYLDLLRVDSDFIPPAVFHRSYIHLRHTATLEAAAAIL